MHDWIALVALVVWPFVPIFLLPLHTYTRFCRRLGTQYYVVALLVWASVAGLISYYRDALLKYALGLGALSYLGIALMLLGMLLQGWSTSIIGIRGTFGWWELFPPEKGKFLVLGPYKYSRHPIYLAHSFMLFGAFFMTGVLSVGTVAFLDFLLSYFVTTRLEERELEERFGKEYLEYKKSVPKFFPRWG